MTANRSCVGIVALCCSAALVITLAMATLGTAVFAIGETPGETSALQSAGQQAPVPQEPASQPQQYQGMVSDTRCGAKHQPSIGKTASDCTRVCVHAGSEFALVDGDKTFVLKGDLARLKNAAGTRVTVTGVLNGNTITASSITTGP